VYPTGTTIFEPERAWNGYTLFQAPGVGALLIDMNGAEVQLWKGLEGFPNKLLPGGQVLGSTGQRNPEYGFQDQLDLVQVGWDGNVVWRFDHHEWIEDRDSPPRWCARQHHDFEREGNPVGYYAPGLDPLVEGGHTFILLHKDVRAPDISDMPLVDDTVVEVDWGGQMVWQWQPHEHIDELGFDADARAVLRSNPSMRPIGGGVGDWLHINSLSLLGPNRFYDAGDERFHPDNLMWSSREANIIAITDKTTGRVVWRLGPRYNNTAAERRLDWIIGQHHPHLIPRGLPGEGNLLVFDNGGWAGYGTPRPGAPNGTQTMQRDYSRVLEVDPVTLEVVWRYTPREAGFMIPLDAARFYSPFISSAQRLPNGNTLIVEGSDGRIFEVTGDHQIVWEYINPYSRPGLPAPMNMVYRAYRYPYDWVPQLPRPDERPIPRLDKATFRLPGAAPIGHGRVTDVVGAQGYREAADFCLVPESDSNDS
jgi:hypothetical protein